MLRRALILASFLVLISASAVVLGDVYVNDQLVADLPTYFMGLSLQAVRVGPTSLHKYVSAELVADLSNKQELHGLAMQYCFIQVNRSGTVESYSDICGVEPPNPTTTVTETEVITTTTTTTITESGTTTTSVITTTISLGPTETEVPPKINSKLLALGAGLAVLFIVLVAAARR